jgi:hypothetical protein
MLKQPIHISVKAMDVVPTGKPKSHEKKGGNLRVMQLNAALQPSIVDGTSATTTKH